MATLSEYKVRKRKILAHLGNQCAACGVTENLQVDHVDHTKKNFTIMNNWGKAWVILLKELKLCQLLCKVCHLEKSISEGSLAKGWTSQPQGPKHGKIWTYSKYGCRCELCMAAKRKTYLCVAKSG